MDGRDAERVSETGELERIMHYLFPLAQYQAKQLKKLKNKQAKKQQVRMLISTLLAGLRGSK